MTTIINRKIEEQNVSVVSKYCPTKYSLNTKGERISSMGKPAGDLSECHKDRTRRNTSAGVGHLSGMQSGYPRLLILLERRRRN